jgi:FkbM family methyltransferase
VSISELLDYSQHGQPLFLKRFIPPAVARWLVDVGANDGVDGSNSRGLILDGWRGVMIEPLPGACEKLRRLYQGVMTVTVHEIACADFHGTAQMTIGLDGSAGQTSSISDDPSFKSHERESFIEVPVERLTDLLGKTDCPKEFGVLLVDAEGVDLQVLKGLDFERFRPAVICTEDFAARPALDAAKYQFLREHGYRFRGNIGPDSIWTCNTLAGEHRSDSKQHGFVGADLPQNIALAPRGGTGIWALDSLPGPNRIVTGWAFGQADLPIPSIVLLKIVNRCQETFYVQAVRYPRRDVADHFGRDHLFMSGFRALLPLCAVPHACSVSLMQFDGSQSFLSDPMFTFSYPTE